MDGRLDGALHPDDRRGKEIRHIEHPGKRGLERGTHAWKSGKAVQQLKQEPGKGLFVGGVTLPLALAELGLIDEYEFVVHPRLAARADIVRGAIEAGRPEAREPAGVRLGGGGDAL